MPCLKLVGVGDSVIVRERDTEEKSQLSGTKRHKAYQEGDGVRVDGY